jgi:hypothetical protein
MNKPTTANSVFSEVLEQIQQTRQKIFSQANAGLIDLYWQIGKTISISQIFKFLPKPITAIKLNVSLKNPVGWISVAHPPCWPSRWMRYAYPPYGAKLHEWLAQELECAK